MPNHVRMFKLVEVFLVERLMQEWKSSSSHRLLKVFGNDWCDWMKKYYDRHTWNEEYLMNVIDYITKNYNPGGFLTTQGAPFHRPECVSFQ